MLIHLHGGHFRRGRKNRQALPMLYRLAGRGWVGISANYPLRDAGTFPADLIAVKRLIAWVRRNADRYGLDPSRIFLAGSSAGGHLASMAGLTANDPALQPGFEGVDTSLAGVIAFGAYLGPRSTTWAGPSSPTRRSTPRRRPSSSCTATPTRSLPSRAPGRSSSGCGRPRSNPVVYIELPGGQHTFDLCHSVRFDTIIDAVEQVALSEQS